MTLSFRSVIALSALTALVGTQPSLAQDAAAVVGPAPVDCSAAKPGPVPKPGAAGAEINRFQKRLDEYKTCVMTYVKTNGARSQELQAQSRAYGDAANAAIDDYNAYVTEVNKQRQDAEKK